MGWFREPSRVAPVHSGRPMAFQYTILHYRCRESLLATAWKADTVICTSFLEPHDCGSVLNVLVNYAKPALQQLGPSIFQKYIDPKHTETYIKKYQNSLQWFTKLLNGHPYRHMSILSRIFRYSRLKICIRPQKPSNTFQFFPVIEEEWGRLQTNTLIKQVQPVPAKFQASI